MVAKIHSFLQVGYSFFLNKPKKANMNEQTWCTHQLQSMLRLNYDTAEELSSYIVSFSSQDDVVEYLEQIVDTSEMDIVQRFAKAFTEFKQSNARTKTSTNSKKSAKMDPKGIPSYHVPVTLSTAVMRCKNSQEF